MGDDVPLLLCSPFYRLVDKECIMVAHKGECHNSNGWNNAGKIRESPTILLAWPENRIDSTFNCLGIVVIYCHLSSIEKEEKKEIEKDQAIILHGKPT